MKRFYLLLFVFCVFMLCLSKGGVANATLLEIIENPETPKIEAQITQDSIQDSGQDSDNSSQTQLEEKTQLEELAKPDVDVVSDLEKATTSQTQANANGATATIKMGIFLPLTGISADAGKTLLDGVTFANQILPMVNNHKIELVVKDDQSTAEGAVLAAKELLKADVDVVLGGYSSTEFLAAAPIFEQAQIVAITPTGTNPDITNNKKYCFRACSSDNYNSKVVASYMYDELGVRKLGFLIDTSSKYSADLAEQVSEHFQKLGGKIAGKVRYTGGATNFDTQIAKLTPIEADRIYFPGYYNDVVHFITQAKEKGLKHKFFGAASIDNPNIFQDLGQAVEELIHSSFAYSPDMLEMNKWAQTFTEQWQNNFQGAKPTSYSAMAYTAYYLLYKAFEKNPNSVDLAQTLENLKGITTPMGIISIGKSREIESSIGFISYKDGNKLYLGDYMSTID